MRKKERITNLNQLTQYFEKQRKSVDDLKVGVEIEKLGVFSRDGKAVPYYDEGGIESLLRLMNEKYGWEIIDEDGEIIALVRKGAFINLEPGGQLELSSLHQRRIANFAEDFDTYIKEIKGVSKDFNIRFLGLGLQPFSSESDIKWIPKGRYKIMSPYLQEKGKLSHEMMKLTAAIQATYDYTSEEDAMDKLRVSMGISSFVTAMIANSPITEGKPNGFMSRRAYIWLNTDPDRCGLIRGALSQDFGFNDYVEYVANVPMMFIKREGKWIPFYGITFKNYIEKGYKGYFPTLEDWELHLTTIFTEVRIKQYLEVRGSDAPPPRLILSIPTLLKGILYNHESRNAAWRLVKDFRWEERLKLQRDVSKYALDAKVKNNKVLDFAKELIAISKEGLKGEIRRKNHDEDESKYLSSLEELIFEEETCPAALLMKEWERGLKRDPKKLIEYCSY